MATKPKKTNRAVKRKTVTIEFAVAICPDGNYDFRPLEDYEGGSRKRNEAIDEAFVDMADGTDRKEVIVEITLDCPLPAETVQRPVIKFKS
jgi:hypothetical protein